MPKRHVDSGIDRVCPFVGPSVRRWVSVSIRPMLILLKVSTLLIDLTFVMRLELHIFLHFLSIFLAKYFLYSCTKLQIELKPKEKINIKKEN